MWNCHVRFEIRAKSSSWYTVQVAVSYLITRMSFRTLHGHTPWKNILMELEVVLSQMSMFKLVKHELKLQNWNRFWERNGKLYLGYWGLKYLKSFVFKFSSREPSQVICLSKIVTWITWWFWMLYVGVRHIRSCNKRRREEGRQEGSCSHPL